MPDDGLVIRASQLTDWADCQRRGAAKQYRGLISEAGFTVRHTKTSMGAAVGTGFHAAAAHVLENGWTPNTVDVAMAAADKAIAEHQGVETDNTTPDLRIARVQLERMLKAWLPLGLTYRPVFTERNLTCPGGDGFTLSGHPDIYTDGNVVIDNKTGTNMPSPHAQLGQYAILVKASGLDVSGVEMHYVKRVGVNQPQPAPVREVYDLVSTVKQAIRTIDVIKESVIQFTKEGDPTLFLPNPMSLLCGQKYCPAHGTDFCSSWRE